MAIRIESAHDADVPALAALNNRFAPEGLTLRREESWVAAHIDDYRVIRDDNGHVLGCVCVDDYSPSLAELVSLAVQPELHGRGYGRALIDAAVALARMRGYPEMFAVSFADNLFLSEGFARVDIARYPEKKIRYDRVSDDEWTVGQKHCFAIRLSEAVAPRDRAA